MPENGRWDLPWRLKG